jgi:1-acyl-sn-glycerol-3-phosphate acyltransferase
MHRNFRLLIKLRDRLYGVWFVSVFCSAALITLGLVACTPGMHRRRLIARHGARLVFRITGAWPDIAGLPHLPREAAVVVANHASYLDGILLTAVLPHNFNFVIKREMTGVPLVHFFLRRLGAHFVERFDAHKGALDTRRIMQAATDGGSLAFFPEGTFRPEPGLGRFQNGAFSVAARAGMPLVPLVIKGTRAMLPAERWLPRPARLSIRIQQPVFAAADPLQAREICRQIILAELGEPDLLRSSVAS